MTTFVTKKLTCAVCGHKSEQTLIASTSAFGAPDLDTRPPPMQRWTIDHSVQECPECGYCTSDISKEYPGAERVVRGERYRQQRNDPQKPDLANKFLCFAMVLGNAEEAHRAMWANMHAAWACDDAGAYGAAGQCRRVAAEILQSRLEHAESHVQPKGGDWALLVDLLRRSWQYDEAWAACREGLAHDHDEIIEKILRFQAKLIMVRDATGHTVEEAMPQNPEKPAASPETPPCPYCGKPLRTAKAKQCFECGKDWHHVDPPGSP